MVLESISATVTECCTKSLRPFFWKLQLAFERQRKLNYNRECRLKKETASGHFTTTPQVSHNRKTKLCALTQFESLPLSPLMWPEILYLTFWISNRFDSSLSSQLLSSLLSLQPYAKLNRAIPPKRCTSVMLPLRSISLKRCN